MRLDRAMAKEKPAQGNWVYCVAFDPQGGTLASGSYDNTVKLWDAQSGKLLRTLEGHTRGVDIVVFSSDGRLLASKSDDQTIRLWSCETWETVAVIPEPTHRDLVDSRARLSSHAAAAGHRRFGARHAERRAIPADPPLGAGLRRAAGQRAGRGRARSITRRARSCWWAITAWANRRWAIA